MSLWTGAAPETIARDLFGDLRERWRSGPQRVWDECDAMLYPRELGGRRPSVKHLGFLPSAAELAQAERSRFVTTFVRAGSTVIANRLLRSDPHPEIATLGIEEPVGAARTKFELAEFTALGMFNMLDEEMVSRRQGWSSWRQAATYSLVIMGKVVAFNHLRESYPGSGAAAYCSRLIDPYSFYHSTHGGYPRVYIEDRYITVAAFKKWSAESDYATLPKELKDKKENEFISVASCWTEELPGKGDDPARPVFHEAVLVEGVPLFDPERRILTSCPYSIAGMRTSPRDYEASPAGTSSTPDDGRLMAERNAEPWYYQLRETLHQIEDVTSLQLDGAALATVPPYIKEYDPGTLAEEDKFKPVTPGSEHYSAGKEQFTIKKVDIGPTQPFFAETVLQNLWKEANWVVPSRLLTPEADAGAAALLFKREIDEQETALIPFALPLSSFYEQTIKQGFEQFLDSDLEFSAKGVWPYGGGRMGKLVLVKFRKEDMPESWDMRILLSPMLPKNDYEALQMVTLATQPGQEKLALEDALELFMKVQNPHEMAQRARRYSASRQPELQKLEALNVKRDDLAALEAELARLRPGSEAWATKRLDAAVLQSDIAALERLLLGQGQSPRDPAAPPRPSPSIMPPEEAGLASPDLQPGGGSAPLAITPGALPNPAAGGV